MLSLSGNVVLFWPNEHEVTIVTIVIQPEICVNIGGDSVILFSYYNNNNERINFYCII